MRKIRYEALQHETSHNMADLTPTQNSISFFR
jgi:hypothetical protein